MTEEDIPSVHNSERRHFDFSSNQNDAVLISEHEVFPRVTDFLLTATPLTAVVVKYSYSLHCFLALYSL